MQPRIVCKMLSKNDSLDETVLNQQLIIRAALYARTSSDNQRFNYSIDEQIDCGRKYAEQRNWVVTHIFCDESERAESIDRPKFQLMLDKAREHCFDVIIFWRIDRFCRSLVDLVNVERALRECGVGLCSVTEFIDTSTSTGRFNFRSIGSVAELEAELIGERARMGLHALAKKHRWPNSRPPLGYNIQADGQLTRAKTETTLVRKIARMYIREKSMPQLAFMLNKAHILTKNGKQWNAASIREILTNEIYVGVYDVAGVREHLKELRILDEKTFKAITETRRRFKQKNSNKPAVRIDRKQEGIEKIFAAYFDVLRDTKK